MSSQQKLPAGDDALRASFKIIFDRRGPFVGPGSPSPDGMTYVGWDQQQELPAYSVDTPAGKVLVPFTPTLQYPPKDYRGDFYVDEFTDAKLRVMWTEAQQNPKLKAEVEAAFGILDIPHEFRLTGTVDPRGKVDPHGDVDLRHVRRPGFFAAAPWEEPIAALDRRTTIVEITVPREVHERRYLGLTSPIKLRGWHVQGEGIDDGHGGRTHPLMIMIAGRTVETTAISDPRDPMRTFDPIAGQWTPVTYPAPSRGTEVWAARPWRQYLFDMVKAGFDVLTLDKRGHGISGGGNDSNMGEQANDLFRALDQLETGEGLRLLTADGLLHEGSSAGGLLLRGTPATQMPVVLCGPSQGSMVSAWAMHKNYVEDAAFDTDAGVSGPPRGHAFKGAILLAPFSGGPGYRSRLLAIVEGANRAKFNVQAFPSSEVLSNVHKWPAVFVGRGLWDFAELLEGSFEFYRRASGLKEIVVVRGPHSEGEWGQENIRYMTRRMVAFATAAILGQQESPGACHPKTLRDLAASSPDFWEQTSLPRNT